MKTYEFFEDPGHGWIAVPLKELIELGIANAISHYSYAQVKNGETIVYLEEDCDFTRFAEAMDQTGKKYNLKSIYQENCSVRNLPSYHPADWHL
jgi:hypothetical protein